MQNFLLNDCFVNFDCYKGRDIFVTDRILKELGINELDFLCWTHIDWDHTKGLSELFRYVSPDTAFILPTGISVREILNSTIASKDYFSKEYRKIFQLIDNNIKKVTRKKH